MARNSADRAAVDVWGRWLECGERPPPLDRFISTALRDIPRKQRTEVFNAVMASACWAVTTWASKHGSTEVPEGEDLFEELRKHPRYTVSVASALTGGRAPSWARKDAEGLVRSLSRRKDLQASLVLWGVPPAWASHLDGMPGLEDWLQRVNVRPPLWLRERADGAGARALRSDGFRVQPSGQALRCEGSRSVARTTACTQGLAVVQDFASQGIVGDLELPNAAWVLDLCAGAGGKTIQLADVLGDRGVVVACDVDPRKLERLRTRVRAAGVASQVRTRVIEPEGPLELGPEVADRRFTCVLVDAPCSATGTWRRNPDARLRHDPSMDYSQLQGELLGKGAGRVAPGGTLIYGTCSVAQAENEEVVARFLSDFPGFQLVTQSRLGPPMEDSDAMFRAVLQRES